MTNYSDIEYIYPDLSYSMVSEKANYVIPEIKNYFIEYMGYKGYVYSICINSYTRTLIKKDNISYMERLVCTISANEIFGKCTNFYLQAYDSQSVWMGISSIKEEIKRNLATFKDCYK